jgi:hypothetical protein
MVRTLVSFDEKQKKWLDAEAKKKGVPMTYVVREAVSEYMSHGGEDRAARLKALVRKTAGSWKGMDGLKYQVKMRKEWG